MLNELQDVYKRDRRSVRHTMVSQILEPKLDGLDLKARPKSL